MGEAAQEAGKGDDVYECAICQEEDLKEIGQLEVCDHCFCVRCILEWSKISNTCPLCKQRFNTVRHKRLNLQQASSSKEKGEKFPGGVIKTHQIPDKDQVLNPEEAAFEDPLDSLVCMECGEGHDDDLILICDSCNQGCHTYCAHPPLNHVPDGDWYCPACAPTLEDFQATQTQTQSSRASRSRAQEISHQPSRNRRAPQTRSARANQPIASSSRATNQRRVRYAERRDQELDDFIVSSSDESSEEFDEGSEDEKELENDFDIGRFASEIASGVGQSRKRSKSTKRRKKQSSRSSRPIPRRRPRLSSERANTASDARRRRVMAQRVANSAPRSRPQNRSRLDENDNELALLPSHNHRRVERLRSNWNTIRQSEDFDGSHSQSHNIQGKMEISKDSDDDDELENVSLAERLRKRGEREKASKSEDVLAKAREALNRHLSNSKNQKTSHAREPESKRQRILNSFGRPEISGIHNRSNLSSSRQSGREDSKSITKSPFIRTLLGPLSTKSEDSGANKQPIILDDTPPSLGKSDTQRNSLEKRKAYESTILPEQSTRSFKRLKTHVLPKEIQPVFPESPHNFRARLEQRQRDERAGKSPFKAESDLNIIPDRQNSEPQRTQNPDQTKRKPSLLGQNLGQDELSDRRQGTTSEEKENEKNLVSFNSQINSPKLDSNKEILEDIDVGGSSKANNLPSKIPIEGLRTEQVRNSSSGGDFLPVKSLDPSPDLKSANKGVQESQLSEGSEDSTPGNFSQLDRRKEAQERQTNAVLKDGQKGDEIHPQTIKENKERDSLSSQKERKVTSDPGSRRIDQSDGKFSEVNNNYVDQLDSEGRRERKAQASKFIQTIIKPWFKAHQITKDEFKIMHQVGVGTIFKSEIRPEDSMEKWLEKAEESVKKAMCTHRISLRPLK